jgi:hypothetical protein
VSLLETVLDTATAGISSIMRAPPHAERIFLRKDDGAAAMKKKKIAA